MKLYTEHKQVILASSSKTRVNYLKQHLDRILVVRHKVDEKKIKDEFIETNFTDLVRLLAKKKAESVMEDYSKNIIIGSDQILVCEGKLINKSENLSDAKNNLINLRGKRHTLISSLYVIKNKKFYFEETKKAEMLFKKISQKKIDEYLSEQNKEVLKSVGSYRIEDNSKYNFLKILKGDYETIIGFPLKNFIKKFMKGKKMTLFVIGKPIKHSLSPLIHNYWINKYQLGLEYKKMEVEKESLPSLIENVREGKITGLNITLPYKKDIISYIDEVSHSAKDIGAINTVFLRGNKVYGENTDGIGFTRALEKKTKFNFSNKSIYILGAGGASYGIISELIKKKVEKIYVTNRTKQKTIQLVNFFKTKNKEINLEFVEWKDLVPNSDVDLIINTTSFGMKDNECLKIDINNLRDTLIFVDIIYNPKETELLKLFKKEGFVCMNGLSMLIEQAAVSFELWFNISLNNKDIEEVKKICEASY